MKAKIAPNNIGARSARMVSRLEIVFIVRPSNVGVPIGGYPTLGCGETQLPRSGRGHFSQFRNRAMMRAVLRGTSVIRMQIAIRATKPMTMR